MNEKIKPLKKKQIIALVLVMVLILNLVLFAFLRYSLIIFWLIIGTVFLVNFLFFKKKMNQHKFIK
ncbi:hypothetical protein COY26_03540 [Candidatus Woesearchaeota archaeon CG_4_10_14_0_2_um_filter_33_10]|nr:MAG: hypothetical protein AUJ83_01920 [Candidatus Woesearchaeota archaeon CG1_02_33_12]PIZ52810.1 MAG: hypothetical protein COY26_03540 [Candidatus Woesearchaeota archaeon CG_4_10_14_0_2_um_filter_33_10]